MSTQRRRNLTDGQKDLAAQAMQTVSDIDDLMERESFQRFLGRFRTRADYLAGQVLHDAMTHEEREALRMTRLGIMEVLKSLHEDRAAQCRVLAGFGLDPGDPML